MTAEPVPWKLTAEKRAAYLEARRAGALRGQAAKSVGISTEAIRQLRHRDPIFREAELDAEDDASEPLELVARELAMAGDRVCLLFLLQNYSRGRLKDMRNSKTEVVVSGTVTHALDATPMERIEALTAQLAARAELRAPVAELENGDVIEDAEVIDEP